MPPVHKLLHITLDTTCTRAERQVSTSTLTDLFLSENGIVLLHLNFKYP